MSPINNLTHSYLQPVLNAALQATGLTANPGDSLSSAGLSSLAPMPDTGQLSPFARLMSTLQQLQQSDPNKYQQVTQQIAANLQAAAQTVQANGNSTAAAQLNQLAADFTSASSSGQLPSIQDLAKALGGHHHHHHSHSAAGDSASNSNPSQPLSQLLSAIGTQNDPLNPMTIIQNTLSNAGLDTTSGG